MKKPKIFIGSSSLGLPVAEQIRNYLSEEADCYLWTETDIWEINRSTFDNLIQISTFFDFGVFVATADDLTKTNSKIVLEPRDNVILEMSLFLGAMGYNKSFLLVEEGVKLPSDFNGIFMPKFKKNDNDSLKEVCAVYVKRIADYYNLGHLSLCPTTALAIGYYKNFIHDLVESIHSANNIDIDGVKYSDFKLKVVVPNDLKGSIREKAHLFYKRNGYVENEISSKFRNHHLWFQLDSKNAPTAIMYDMPSTLTGIDDAIELILQKNYSGRTKIQNLLEQKELFNFKRVLQIQIDKSPLAKDVVEIIDEF